jgi:hypothetical protein
MSGGTIIRAGSDNEQVSVRSFSSVQRHRAEASKAEDVAVEAEPVQKRSAMVELIETVALRDAEISKHEEALSAAWAEGEAAGRAAAEDALEDDRDAALSALKHGIELAGKDFSRSLEGFEPLALLVAVEAVEKLTGDAKQYRRMLTDAIKTRVGEFQSAAVVSIIVAHIDFPDTREVVALEQSLGIEAIKVSVSDELDASECRIKLLLGQAEINLLGQWDDLKHCLSDLSQSNDATA